MLAECNYRTFPGGQLISGKFDLDTGLVVGVPKEIICIKDNPTIRQFMATDLSYWAPTLSSKENIARTIGIFPQASLIIADSRYHTFVITKGATFIYGMESDLNEYESKIVYNEDGMTPPVLFPQEFKSIGFVKTIPKYYDWYEPMALLNVFKYNGIWSYMRDGEIKKFNFEYDETPDYSKMSIPDLANADQEVYGIYQQNGKNKYLY